MACFHPLSAWTRAVEGTFATGPAHNVITFHEPHPSIGGDSISLPCGQCCGCKIERTKQWAIRNMHEAQMHEHSQFVTLTYNNENLPDDHSLHKIHFQKYIRKLRRRLPHKVRYYMCGEYGSPSEDNGHIARPHYHCLLYGYEYPDTKYWYTKNGQKLYTSTLLEQDWGRGFCVIGNVDWESAAYVSRYILKKQSSVEHYVDLDGVYRLPEYTGMSLKPGIGATWYEKYGQTDCHNNDTVISINQKSRKIRKQKPPRYYDVLLDKIDPEALALIKENRIATAAYWAVDNTPARLKVRENIQLKKLEHLHRNTI